MSAGMKIQIDAKADYTLSECFCSAMAEQKEMSLLINNTIIPLEIINIHTGRPSPGATTFGLLLHPGSIETTEPANSNFEFKYSLDETVITPFGKEGLVDMLGFDEGGRKYYVKTETNSDWFKEDQLKQNLSSCSRIEQQLRCRCGKCPELTVGNMGLLRIDCGCGEQAEGFDLQGLIKEWNSDNGWPRE